MSKPEVQWTEEERKSFKEFEKKVKDLSEEQEKYRKVWLDHITLKGIVHPNSAGFYCQALKMITKKHHKSYPYNTYTIFQVIWVHTVTILCRIDVIKSFEVAASKSITVYVKTNGAWHHWCQICISGWTIPILPYISNLFKTLDPFPFE